MQVTITNATAAQLPIGMLYKTLEPNGSTGDAVTVRKTVAEMNGDQTFKTLVENGSVTLAFAVETGDSAVLGHPATLEAFANAVGLPAAAARPLFTTVWQTDAAYAVWTDGTNWRDAAGTITT